jgi:uncharacterized protein YbcI
MPAEQALKDSGRAGLVRRTRLAFEDVMTHTFTSSVEELTGARVIGYHSQVAFDPDFALECFVLDRPLGAEADGGRALEPATHAQPGEVGDADAVGGTVRDSVLARSERREPARMGEGQLRASVANSLVRLLHEYWGKGPTRSRVFFEDQFVFCAFEEPFTTVERTLLDAGEKDLVRELRIEAHEAQRATFDDEVARATGRPVLTSLAQVVFSPDLLFLCFVLAPADVTAKDR